MIHARATILGGLFLWAVAPLSPVTAAVEVPAEITSDSLWIGTIDINHTVTVRKGATLLIMPGTILRFAASAPGAPDKAGLRVEGSLVAQGNPGKPILFTSAAEKPARGDWAGIVFDRANQTPSRLRHCSIRHATEGIRGASSFLFVEDTELANNVTGLKAERELAGGIFGCTITGNTTGALYYQSSGLSIENSLISGNSDAGVVCVFGSSPMIRQSEISGNAVTGVSCLQGSSPRLEGNLIRGNGRGVHVELKSRPVIFRNDILENATGVWAEKLVFPQIVGNLIARNGTGIYCNFSGYPVIHGNNIVDNEHFGIVLGDNMSIVMEKQIPFRDMGRFSFDKPAQERKDFPPQSRKFTPFTASDEGVVDARGNWWGQAALQEMEDPSEKKNVSVIEDAFDKPDTWYEDKTYPRDRVVYADWEKKPIEEAGRPAKTYAGIRGRVVHGGKPIAGARVFSFREEGEESWSEGVSYSSPTDDDGEYSLHLSPGTYHLTARKTAAAFPHLDLQPGDLVGSAGEKPIAVAPGIFTEVTIEIAVPPPAGEGGLNDPARQEP